MASEKTHEPTSAEPTGGMNGDHLQNGLIERYQTVSSVVIPKEVFEAMYLSPYTRTSGHLRSIFGNPTPV